MAIVKTYKKNKKWYCRITNHKAMIRIQGLPATTERKAIKSAKQFYKFMFPLLNGLPK